MKIKPKKRLMYMRLRIANGCSCGGELEVAAYRDGFGYWECVACKRSERKMTMPEAFDLVMKVRFGSRWEKVKEALEK